MRKVPPEYSSNSFNADLISRKKPISQWAVSKVYLCFLYCHHLSVFKGNNAFLYIRTFFKYYFIQVIVVLTVCPKFRPITKIQSQSNGNFRRYSRFVFHNTGNCCVRDFCFLCKPILCNAVFSLEIIKNFTRRNYSVWFSSRYAHSYLLH